jgi:hypothetical protein
VHKFEVVEGRSSIKICLGGDKTFWVVRSQRSSALVSREDLLKFINPKYFEEAE